MNITAVAGLTAEQEAKLRESFKRCSPETLEAILRFRNERDLDSVIVVVNGVIERYLKLEPGQTLAQRADSTRLGEDLGIDSLTMLEIVMSIEEALDFRIEDSEARNIRTLGEVRLYVDERVHGRPISLAVIERYERDRLCLILPQQPPFLFLDKAEIQGDIVRATYRFREDESFFAGHFRDEPVVPASIVYEAIGQACCLWVLEQVPARTQQVLTTNQVLFVGMGEARFFKRAKPLDEIHIEQSLTRLRAPLAVFQGVVKVRDQILARVEGLTLAFGDFNPATFDATPEHAATNGNTRDEVLASLREARSGIEIFEELPNEPGSPRLAGTIKGFSLSGWQCDDWTYPPAYSIERNHLRSMSPHVVYAWCAMQQAIADARLGPELVSHPRTGAMCASGGSMSTIYENFHVMVTEGVHKCYPLSLPAGIPGTLNSNLAASFKLKGAVVGFASACSSSAHAFGYGYDLIRGGRQDRVFVVGAEDCNKFSILPFAGVRALSLRTDPNLAPAPFDLRRDGFVGTGGATVLVLEELEAALARGVPIYAEALGWGEAADGYNVMAPEPEGEGLTRAMQQALAQTGLQPAQIDYINAHATGTTVGDLSEVKAIRRVLASGGKQPCVSSTKALTGHGLCLAGAMEAAFTVLALKEGFMPISAKITQLDPACASIPILTKPSGRAPKIALSNSSGFGGSNVSLVLGRYAEAEGPPPPPTWDHGAEIAREANLSHEFTDPRVED